MGQKWLLKSEPDVWSFNQQRKAGNKGASWDGVRNYQAANNLKQMKKLLGILVLGLFKNVVFLKKKFIL